MDLPTAPIEAAEPSSPASSHPDQTPALPTQPHPQYVYSVSNYRYSKTQPHAVHCPSPTIYKTTAASLAEQAGGRWTHRAKGYLMSERQLHKFQDLVTEHRRANEARQLVDRAPLVAPAALAGP